MPSAARKQSPPRTVEELAAELAEMKTRLDALERQLVPEDDEDLPLMDGKAASKEIREHLAKIPANVWRGLPQDISGNFEWPR